MRPVVGFADLVRATVAIGGDELELAEIAALLGIVPECAKLRERETDPGEGELQRPERRRERGEASRPQGHTHRRRVPRSEPPPPHDDFDHAGDSRSPAIDGERLSVESLPPREPAGGTVAGAPAIAFDPTGARARIEHHPLIAPRLARAAISRLVARAARDSIVDLDVAIDLVAHARPVLTLPQRQRPTLRFGAQVLVDVGDGMLPFSADAADLERRIRAVVAGDRLQVCYFRDHPATVRGSGGGSGWRAYAPPAPGTPVLAVSDLAIARGGLRGEAEQCWTDLAAMLARAGSALTVLVPFRAASPIPEIAVTPWEHPPPAGVRALVPLPPHTEDGLDVVEFAAAQSEAYALARMVALTARCEPALLRGLRRRFRGAADAGAEAQLWASPLVEARSVGGIRLRPEAVQVLLETWHGDPELGEVVAAIADAHRGAPSVVRWQEELVAGAVRALPDDLRRIDDLLAGVTAAIASDDTSAATAQLCGWAAHALPRLPDEVRRRAPAIRLAALSSLRMPTAAASSARLPIGSLELARQDRAIGVRAPAPLTSIAEVMSARASARCRMGVRRAAGRAELRRLVPGEPGRACEVELDVPDTRPVLVEVRTGDDAALVALGSDPDPVELDWRSGPLDLYGIDGAGYRVRPVDIAQRLDRPWTSLARLDDGQATTVCGYLVDARAVVLDAGGRDWSGIDPVVVGVGGVLYEARTMVIDRGRSLVVVVLDRDAAEPPLADALRATRIEDGVMELRSFTEQGRLLAFGADERDRYMDRSGRVTSGMPVIRRGGLAGLLREDPAASVVHRSRSLSMDVVVAQAFTITAAHEVADLVRRGRTDIDRVLALADELVPHGSPRALAEVDWADRHRGAPSLQAPPLRLANAMLHTLASRSPELRVAALLWWETAPSRCALSHVVDALGGAASPGEQLVAIRCAAAGLELWTSADARVLAARIDDLRISLSPGSAIGAHASELRSALSAIVGRQRHAELPPLEELAHLEHRPLSPMADLVRDARGGVFVITGGNGATRLGLIDLLVRQSRIDEHPHVVCAFGSESATLDALHTAAKPFADTRSPADALAAMAAAGACVVLDGLRWLWSDEGDAATATAALLAGFAAGGRGHCLVTWPSLTAIPKLGETGRVISLDGMPVDPYLRELLDHRTPRARATTFEYVLRVAPVTATCALLDVVEFWVARPLDAGDASIPAREAVLAWRERPWRSPDGAEPLKRAFGEIGVLALLAMEATARWLCSNIETRSLDPLARAVAQLFEAVESRIGTAAIYNGLRRAYVGARYSPEGVRSWVIALAAPSLSAIDAVARRLPEIARGPVDVEVVQERAGRMQLVCSSSSPLFRRVLDAWRGGGLTRAGEVEPRWLAELRSLPDPRDPQKSHFGSLPERDGRIATATVTALRTDWFEIRIEVAPLPGAPPLRRRVRLHLHDSFPKDVIDLPVRDGRAVHTARAWGSFTVGIECDDGATRLELDLALVPGVPAAFLDEDRDREPWLEVARHGLDLPLREGTRWEYVRVDAARPRLRSAWVPWTMRVAEVVHHHNRTRCARILGHVLGHALDLERDVWILWRSEGQYYFHAPNGATEVRLRDHADSLDWAMQDSNEVLCLPTYAGARFSGPGWMMTIEDVRYDTLEIVGASKHTAIYRARYERDGMVATLEIAPGVGILNVTPRGGRFAWWLRELHLPPSNKPKTRQRPAGKPPRKTRK